LNNLDYCPFIPCKNHPNCTHHKDFIEWTVAEKAKLKKGEV